MVFTSVYLAKSVLKYREQDKKNNNVVERYRDCAR